MATPELEDLWYRALERTALVSARNHVRDRVQLLYSFQRASGIGREIAGPLDLPSLREALLRGLPAVGVRDAFVSRYPDGNTAQLESLVCLRQGAEWRPPVARYAATDFVPPQAYPEDQRRTLVILPVTVNIERWGLLVFGSEADSRGQHILRDALIAALRYLHLHQEVVHQTMLRERSMQERLATTKRMRALSVLAGGVAHDLNNALGPLVGLPDIILHELDQADPAQGAFAELRADVVAIKGASQRAAQTIKDLLTLGRQGRTSREPLDLNRAVAGCVSAALPQLTEAPNRRVSVVVDVPEEPLVVRASEAQLARAITNLVRNAVEAIPADGQVVVRTRQTSVMEPTVGYETIPAGDYAVVTVSDNGEGIPADQLGWVFEPFASRKRLGDNSGTGLGLAIVHGVVKEHEGFVDVTSTVGQGTTFSLYLPCTQAKVRSSRPVSAAPPGCANILIVDDEPVQLRTGRRILTHLGYQVDTMTSGAEAYRLFAEAATEGRQPHDLVILDMLLNEDWDGLQIYEQILRLFPKQRAMVASGHAPTERAEQAVARGLGWLAKPYTPQALAKAVRSALADPTTLGSPRAG